MASDTRGVRGGTVRLTIPAAVANDLNALRKGLTSFVERLGCRTCFSGADCHFHVERDFVINENLRADPQPSPWRTQVLEPVPSPWAVVRLDREISFNLEKVQTAIERVVGRLGCTPCCSGFDIFFQQELEAINVDRNGNVTALGR